MFVAAVFAEVARHRRRSQIMVVQQQVGQCVATARREVSHESISGPGTHLRLVGLGEPNELVDVPDQLRHR